MFVGKPSDAWEGFLIWSPSGRTGIALEQLDRRTFRLASIIAYSGETGLDLDEAANKIMRTVGPATLPITDLASVPGPFRWWAHSYGVHTPAALIHDRFIGDPVDGQPGRPAGVTEQDVDRYFRFMLRRSQVPYLRSWLMWAAVASRTRLVSGKRRAISMILWLIAAVVGVGILGLAVLSGWWSLAIVAAVLPVPAAVLWGRQAGAGVIIAYVGVPFLLLPSLLAVPFLFLFAGLEAATAQFIEIARGPVITNDEHPDPG